MIINKESRLRRLVELYGVYRAYEEVSRTCDLHGFKDMFVTRRNEFESELRRYSRDFHGSDDRGALALSMDDVLNSRNQLTLF